MLDEADVGAARAPITVNVRWQAEEFNAASVTVIVTVVGPGPTFEPATGDWVISSAFVAVQLSVADTECVKSGTSAWHPAPASDC
jgi:hypothetical protein